MTRKRKSQELVKKVWEIDSHRNGSFGAPFKVVLFQATNGCNMVGVVFNAQYHVAVFDVDKLAKGDIAFESNSFRGDEFEIELRAAIKDLE